MLWPHLPAPPQSGWHQGVWVGVGGWVGPLNTHTHPTPHRHLPFAALPSTPPQPHPTPTPPPPTPTPPPHATAPPHLQFGKSEGGAIWLSPEALSPYQFYQHLLKTTDADVGRMLRTLTFLPLDEVAAIEGSMQVCIFKGGGGGGSSDSVWVGLWTHRCSLVRAISASSQGS